MAAPTKLSYKVYQGSTFSEVYRYESANRVYKNITNITATAPAVVTAASHGMPVGWRAKITDVKGMKEINNSDEYFFVTAADANTVTFGDINAASYSAYTSGGILEYNEPVSLAGMTARMQIREKVSSSNIILELTTQNGLISINDTSKYITVTIPAATTELFTFKSAVYSMELVSGSVVIPFIYGTLTLETEVTR